MNSTPEDLVKALRRSLKQNERLKRENRDLLARTTEPAAMVVTQAPVGRVAPAAPAPPRV